MLLINRKKELAFLEKAYLSNKSEFIIVYGRRRLGKTYLLKYFSENKKKKSVFIFTFVKEVTHKLIAMLILEIMSLLILMMRSVMPN